MRTFEPKRKTRSAAVISLVLFVLAVVIFYISNLDSIGAPAILQLIALIFASVSIFILAKFVIMKYTYWIDQREDGGADLMIFQESGKRKVMLCNISLSDAVSLEKLSGRGLPEKEKKLCSRIYNYCLELFPEVTYALIVEDMGGRYAIKLPYEKDMIKMIEAYIGK